MVLYNFDSSPNPLKVRIALKELGLEYENREVVLFKAEQKKKEFLEVNPLGKVPVLIDNKLKLRESNAILSYLGRKYGKALWPEDLEQEAEATQWLFFESVHMSPHFGTVWFNKFGMPKLGYDPQPDVEIQDAIEDSEWALDHLEKHFEKYDYILGGKFSLVDCSIGVQVSTLSETMLSLGNKWKYVSAYRDRIISRPSWEQALGNKIFTQEK